MGSTKIISKNLTRAHEEYTYNAQVPEQIFKKNPKIFLGATENLSKISTKGTSKRILEIHLKFLKKCFLQTTLFVLLTIFFKNPIFLNILQRIGKICLKAHLKYLNKYSRKNPLWAPQKIAQKIRITAASKNYLTKSRLGANINMNKICVGRLKKTFLKNTLYSLKKINSENVRFFLRKFSKKKSKTIS